MWDVTRAGGGSSGGAAVRCGGAVIPAQRRRRAAMHVVAERQQLAPEPFGGDSIGRAHRCVQGRRKRSDEASLGLWRLWRAD